MKNYDSIQNSLGYILIFLIVIAVHIFAVFLIWCGVRSLLGKTLSLPPSRRKWFRTRADVTQDEETAKYHARYYFEGEKFTSEIDGFTVYGDKAIIYVNRNSPKEIKEYIPRPPMGTEVNLACFFMVGIILFLDIIIFFG